MAKPEKNRADISETAEKDAKIVARAGPAGILLVSMIVLALLGIVILAFMLLGSKH